MSEESKQEVVKETIFDVIIEMLIIAFVFLVPVIFDRRVGIVFSLTKTTTLRILIVAMIAIWMIKIVLKNKHTFVRSPIDWSLAAYMLACTVATVTSVHVITSFMGFYGRYEGLSTLWVYGFLAFLIPNFIRRREQILRIFYTIIVAGIFMGLYSVIQRAGLDPYAWGGVITNVRVIGTIGQPNFLAAYVDMAFIIGLAVLLTINVKMREEWNHQRMVRIIINVILIIGLLLIYVCILYTQSRGGFLGLIAGMSLFLSLTNRELIIRNWKKFALLFSLIFAVSYLTMLNPNYSPIARMGYEAERINESNKQETPIIKYSAALSRLETWKSGYRLMAARPTFGIGQEVLKMIFPQFETEYFRFYEGFHVKQDRMHNEICDMAVTRGILTLFIYIWLLSTFFWMGIKIINSDRNDEMKLYTAALLGAVTAYLIQNQFSFGVVAIGTLLWICIGLVSSIYVGEPEVEKKSFYMDWSKFPWLYMVLIVVFAVSVSYYSAIQFRADIHYKSGKVLSKMSRFDVAVSEFEKSIAISPYEGGTWTHFGIASLNLAQTARSKDLLDRSINIFAQATEIDPYNADNFYIMGRAYLIKASFDRKYLDSVLRAEEKAVKIDPRYAEAFQIQGMVYERKGESDRAFEMFRKALEVNPSLGESMRGLLNISARKGSYTKAIDIFKEFLEKYPNNILYLENLAFAYVRKGDNTKAEDAYVNLLEIAPKNVRALNNLGFVYAKTGKIALARDKFNQAVIINPKSVDAHNGLGLIFLKTGNAKKAREEFLQTLVLDANNQYAKKMLEQIK